MSESSESEHSGGVPIRDYKGTRIFELTEIDKIERMTVRDEDTWIISFPRSGTTITQEITYLLKTNLDFQKARDTILDERVPFLDLKWGDAPGFNGVEFIDHHPSPRLIKSHLHYHVLPQQLFTSTCKKIYVMRNPKDVCISQFMLLKSFKRADGNQPLESFVDAWMRGEVYASPWWLHVHDFWLHRNDPNLLVITYEDLVQDMPGTVKTMAEHLEVTVTTDQVLQIADHCSFNNMRNNSAVNPSWFNKDFGGFIRKGKVGGWRNYLTPELSKKLDTHVHEKLGQLDIKFDFGD